MEACRDVLPTSEDAQGLRGWRLLADQRKEENSKLRKRNEELQSELERQKEFCGPSAIHAEGMMKKYDKLKKRLEQSESQTQARLDVEAERSQRLANGYLNELANWRPSMDRMSACEHFRCLDLEVLQAVKSFEVWATEQATNTFKLADTNRRVVLAETCDGLSSNNQDWTTELQPCATELKEVRERAIDAEQRLASVQFDLDKLKDEKRVCDQWVADASNTLTTTIAELDLATLTSNCQQVLSTSRNLRALLVVELQNCRAAPRTWDERVSGLQTEADTILSRFRKRKFSYEEEED